MKGVVAALLASCAPEAGSPPFDGGVVLPPPLLEAGIIVAPALDASASDSGGPAIVVNDDTGVTDAAIAAPAPSSSLLPFRVGCTWTYRVTGAAGTTMKVTTVGPEEPVGGSGPNRDLRAFRVTTLKGTSDRTESWQAVVGSSVLRYREVSYAATTGLPELEEHWVPSKLHVHSAPAQRAAGARWSESYQETKTIAGMAPISAMASDTWTVDAPKVSVTVPAGTFEAVVLMKSTATGSKTYWYVEGVGKVKETGGQTEELVSFDVDP